MLENSMGSKLDEQSRNYLLKINNSSARMNKLIRDVLTYSELVKENDIFSEVDLNMVVEGITTDYELLIEQKGAEIKCGKLPVIEAIPLQMSQLFGNMISNALKFTQKGISPHIVIRSTDELDGFSGAEGFPGKFYHIHVKDNGIGFDEKYSKNIFNLFEKLHSKDDYEGSGIGLAICKKIIEKHHGYISVKTKPGAGSDFIVSLPVDQGSQA